MASDFPGEFAFIDWIRSQTTPAAEPPAADGVIVGIGDDCAVLAPRANATLVTTDMLMEGSCFLLAEAGPFRVGRKAMAVNISDIAAMAGTPRTAFVSLGLPRTMSFEQVKELHLGLQSMAAEFGVTIAGGDTNTWDGPLTISVTLIGETGPGGPVLRSGAKIGDVILVTGSLGGSILGHHLDFTPRVGIAAWIAKHSRPHAMIDISDGLAKDLHRIVTASGVGAELVAESIPISTAAMTLAARDGRSGLEHALGDGEDFELVVTLSAEDAEQLLVLPAPDGATLSRIGRVVDAGYWLTTGGIREPLQPLGYEHAFGRPV